MKMCCVYVCVCVFSLSFLPITDSRTMIHSYIFMAGSGRTNQASAPKPFWTETLMRSLGRVTRESSALSSVQHLEFRRDPFNSSRDVNHYLPIHAYGSLSACLLGTLPENSLFGQGCASCQQHSRKTDKKVLALLLAAIVPPAEEGGVISWIRRMSRTCDITTRKRSGFLFLVGRTVLVCS